MKRLASRFTIAVLLATALFAVSSGAQATGDFCAQCSLDCNTEADEIRADCTINGGNFWTCQDKANDYSRRCQQVFCVSAGCPIVY